LLQALETEKQQQANAAEMARAAAEAKLKAAMAEAAEAAGAGVRAANKMRTTGSTICDTVQMVGGQTTHKEHICDDSVPPHACACCIYFVTGSAAACAMCVCYAFCRNGQSSSGYA